MKSLPEDVQAYSRTPEFSQDTLPAGLGKRHTTREGVWGRIVVLEGSLRYRILEQEPEEVLLGPEREGVVEPEVPHEVEPMGTVRFYVEFLRASGDTRHSLPHGTDRDQGGE
jgi:tellurite resistance-related uncharacterized protein